MRSQVTERILKQMEADLWQVKFKRWVRLKYWIIMCRTRFIWDLDYQNNIFK